MSRLSKTSTWNSWKTMISRCTLPSHISYPLYGAKGIVVCDRWRNFLRFLEDMGFRPEGTTLDRIDPACGYYPENCRWATWIEQANNRSGCVRYYVDGSWLTAREAGTVLGISAYVVRYRANHGLIPKKPLYPAEGFVR